MPLINNSNIALEPVVKTVDKFSNTALLIT